MSESIALVGLDVHRAQSVAAVLDPVTGELRVERLRGAADVVVPGFLQSLGRPVRAVYEAGPMGFALARAAIARGLDLRVIAPGSIPKAPGDRVKTDRRDATRLARLFAAGELSFVFVPSEEQERFRDLVRCIDDVRRDLMRARHRLSKFLLRRGEHFPGGRAWTTAHAQWLRTRSFDDVLSTAVLIDYSCAVDALVARRKALTCVLEEAVPHSSHALVIARLRCFRGIDTLTAAGLCAELSSFERFAKPTLLSGFLGIVPSEYTSDSKRVQGQITKAGSTHARRLLVEAAHHYRHRPAIGDTLAARQAGQDPRVIEIASRAQRRLYHRWTHLAAKRGKPTGNVAVAVARELAAFCWEAATLN